MSTAWLKAHIPGFGDLSLAERRAIADFTMLWTLFEARVLGEHVSAQRIVEAVIDWDQHGTLNANAFGRALTYFRDRYYANGGFTHHFDGLHLRQNDQPALVRGVLEGSENNTRARVVAVLIVVFRYRNNLFHGVKWQYKLAGQLQNFRIANGVLKRALEQHGNLLGS